MIEHHTYGYGEGIGCEDGDGHGDGAADGGLAWCVCDGFHDFEGSGVGDGDGDGDGLEDGNGDCDAWVTLWAKKELMMDQKTLEDIRWALEQRRSADHAIDIVGDNDIMNIPSATESARFIMAQLDRMTETMAAWAEMAVEIERISSDLPEGVSVSAIYEDRMIVRVSGGNPYRVDLSLGYADGEPCWFFWQNGLNFVFPKQLNRSAQRSLAYSIDAVVRARR